MDVSDIPQLIVLLILLLLSAFFSSAETALTTVNKIRMRTLSEAGNKKADRVLRVTEDQGKMLSAILIGNNLVNISASSLATIVAMDISKDYGASIATGVLTLLVLIFGEVTPKTMATLKADKLSLRIAWIIDILIKVFTPIIFIINKISAGVLFLLGVDPKAKAEEMTEEELRTIVDVSQETGVIEDEERDMIHNLFDFGDAKAKEIMVPRIDMTFVHVDSSYDEILEIFRENMYTRLPVYEDTTDKVIGIINMKDILLWNAEEHEEDASLSLRDIMREPYFTFENKNTADLFIEMRHSSLSIAIVLDEFGATAGLVTLEDLLEEIVGEIRDEYDTDEVDDITRLSDREYMIQASANLDDVSDELEISLSSDDYDTIGGYCLEQLGHLPEKNEIIITDDNLLLRIDEIDDNRISRIYLKLPAREQQDI